jgi:high-affinity Fe2+/Pb2+ permease
MPVSEQLYGRYPRAQFLGAAFALSAGVIFAMLGLDMHGTARAGITGMGVLAILAGVWQGVSAVATRRATMAQEPPNNEMQRTSPGQE